MRRKDREISEYKQIESILSHGKICRLAMIDNNIPYIVPLSYGYKENTLYFHCAREGRKLDILRNNNYVCFEIESDFDLIARSASQACKWGVRYRSVIGYGHVHILEDHEVKREGLTILMDHYSGHQNWKFTNKSIVSTVVLKLLIESISAKESQ